MKKEIRKVDKEKGIVQITTVDERWYARESKNKKTGLPEYEFVPSVTWIAGCYPKGVGFYKWLAQRNWDEAEAIKQEAGDKGSRVHKAIVDLLNKKEVKMDDKYFSDLTEEEKPLNLEEYEGLMSFVDWFNGRRPVILDKEFVVWREGYAGTVDMLCRIGGKTYIVDFKTSQSIWPSHEIQISAYKHALDHSKVEKGEEVSLMILQLGYKRNQRLWKENEVQDKFDLFQSAVKIWENENSGVSPSQKDYPQALSLLEEEKVKEKPKK